MNNCTGHTITCIRYLNTTRVCQFPVDDRLYTVVSLEQARPTSSVFCVETVVVAPPLIKNTVNIFFVIK